MITTILWFISIFSFVNNNIEEIKQTATIYVEADKISDEISKEVLSEFNKVKEERKQKIEKEKIVLYFPDNLIPSYDSIAKLDCSRTTKFLKWEEKFIIYNKNVSYEKANECFKIWNFDISNFSWNIYFLNKNNKGKIEKKLWIKIITNKRIKDYMKLYNLLNNKNTFKFKSIWKTFRFEISKKDWKDFIKFSIKLNKKIENNIKVFNTFLTKNKIKQNMYAWWWKSFNTLVRSDGVKCNSYTLTLYLLNWQKIIWFNVDLDKDYKPLFKSIDEYRQEINIAQHYVGWTNYDINQYLRSLFYGNMNFKKWENYLFTFIDTKTGQTKTWKWLYHSGLKICNLSKCWVYFPDEGQFVEEKRYWKVWKHKKYKFSITFNLIKNKILSMR